MVQHDTLPGKRHWSWYRITHCQVKYTGCGTAWHIARWNTLVVVLYDILLGCTGRGTVRHITRWNTLVVVPYDTLPGERYWSWYHMTHWQVRGTGRGTVWHIARRKALVMVRYDILSGGTVWHILTHDHVGNEYKISTNSETIKVFDNIYAFVSIENARLLTSMWLITRLG